MSYRWSFYGLYPERGRRVYSAADWRRNGAGRAAAWAIGLFSVMCLFGIGVVVGTFHVGQPLRALNMLLRVGHSPMSNEIALSAALRRSAVWGRSVYS